MNDILSSILAPIAAGLGLLIMGILGAAGAMAIRYFNSKYKTDAETAARADLRGAAYDSAKEQKQISIAPPAEKKAAAVESAEASLGSVRMAEIVRTLGEDATKATLSTGIEAAVHDMKAAPVADTTQTVTIDRAGTSTSKTTASEPPV